MRKIEEGIEVTGRITLAASVQQAVSLPSLGDRVAYQVRAIDHWIAPTSALPTSGAAGLWMADVVVAGKDQVVPANPRDVERIVQAFSVSGQAAGAGAALNYLFYTSYANLRTWVLFRELFLYGITLNMATFTTYDFSLSLDAYQLTTSEYVDLLD